MQFLSLVFSVENKNKYYPILTPHKYTEQEKSQNNHQSSIR